MVRSAEDVERAIERTGAKYMGDMAALYDRINGELGRLYEARLAEKDATIAAKDHALAIDALAIAELRRRAEEAEGARDRLAAAQGAQGSPGARGGTSPTIPSPEPSAGLWTRLRGVFGGGRDG